MKKNESKVELPDGLGTALYFLHYMPNVRDENKYSQLKEVLIKDYSLKEVKRMANALKWIQDNPSTSPKIALPNIKQSDEDTRYYIDKMCALLAEYNE